MTDLKGKVIVVSGASSGMGKSIVETLVKAGSKVVGFARNFAKLQEIANRINHEGPGQMLPFKCDVTVEKEVIAMFKFTEEKFGTLNAVVNNAGIVENEPLLTGSCEGWMKMLQVNVMGVATCSREGINMMKKHGVDKGHVININTVFGRVVPNAPLLHFYTVSKFGVTALSQGLLNELRASNSKIRVTTISPAFTNTEIFGRAVKWDEQQLEKIFPKFKILEPQDIADAVVYALSAPPRVNVSEIIMTSDEQLV